MVPQLIPQLKNLISLKEQYILVLSKGIKEKYLAYKTVPIVNPVQDGP